MHKNSAFFSLGVSKQENMQVSSKCTLMIDPDAHVRGEPCIYGVSPSLFLAWPKWRKQKTPQILTDSDLGNVQEEVTDTISALWWIKYVTCLILPSLLITLPERWYIPAVLRGQLRNTVWLPFGHAAGTGWKMETKREVSLVLYIFCLES